MAVTPFGKRTHITARITAAASSNKNVQLLLRYLDSYYDIGDEKLSLIELLADFFVNSQYAEYTPVDKDEIRDRMIDLELQVIELQRQNQLILEGINRLSSGNYSRVFTASSENNLQPESNYEIDDAVQALMNAASDDVSKTYHHDE